MDPQTKQLLEELGTAFTEFKAQHKRELDEIRAHGSASAETKAAVERVNAQITELQDKVTAAEKKSADRIEELETLMARTKGADLSPEDRAKQVALVAPFLARARRRSVDEVASNLTDDDLAAVRAYKPAFLAFLRSGGNNGDSLTPEVRAAMSVGVDPEGGYLVPPDMSGRLAQLVYESSPIRQIATVSSTRSDRKTGRYDLDQAGAGWVGETQSRGTTTTPTLGGWEIPVREMYAQPEATQQEIDDSIVDIEAWLVQKVSDRFGRLEAAAGISGDGIAKWRGILTYADGVPSASAFQVIERTKTGADGAFAGTDPGNTFIDVVGKLKAPYLANARWIMNRGTLAAVRKLKDGDDTYLWEKSFQAGSPFQILGYPVTLAEDMPAYTVADALAIGFGDFREGYEVVDRMGVRVLRDPYTNKPFVRLYTTKRSGGDVVNFEAIKLMQFGD